MKARALIWTLLLVAAFWFVTTHGNWNVQRLIQPISSRGKLWSEPVTAYGSGFTPDEQNNIDIYKANRLATVNITSIVYQRDFFFQVFPQKGIGSGFIVNADGEIVTNNHVISGSRNITVTLSDKSHYPATVLGIDRRNDLAILRIRADRKLPIVHLGNSDDLVVGQKVLAIGNPFGLEGTLTTGIVSSLGRSLEGEEGNALEGLIQTDAAINPGNSGGPLLNSRGEVIGINTAIFGSQTASGEAGSIGIGFAMPINRAKERLDEYSSTGRISRPVLGITQTFLIQGDLAEELEMPRSGGLLIEGIDEGSPADAAGLRGPNRTVIVGRIYRLNVGGDLIIAIDGSPVESQDALRRALNQKRPGEKMVLTIFRGKGTMKVTVTLGSAPEAL
ncbi:MAG TPA: trypsin-like peptidase domain-containing protein [Bryobacteraceae bacterium]|jgi:S1-C subfamily serine protease|nr:trypsin-like peptidase domain-containing protein [Bryobacteraceae bacterium]